MLPPFRLEAYFSRWEFAARYNLAASDAETWSLDELLALASTEQHESWDRMCFGDTQTFGAPGLRDAIAATYEAISPEDVICFAGGEEGLSCAMHALLSAPDHAVVVAPNYQSAEELPLSICRTSCVGLQCDDGGTWRLDLDALESALQPNTRVIAINFPNNPTGAMIDAPALARIVELARARGIHVVSDEAYRGLERSRDIRLPQVADLD